MILCEVAHGLPTASEPRASLALQIFHHLPTGGGGGRTPTPTSTHIGRREKKNEKAFESS